MNKVKETQLEEVEILQQEEEVEAAMKENQVGKALYKDVIFVRRIVMLKKIIGSREILNVLTVRSLATCKRIVDS